MIMARRLRIFCALCALVVGHLYSKKAAAFDYKEHHDLVCDAVDVVCANVASMSGYEARRNLVQRMLCAPSCGNRKLYVQNRRHLFDQKCADDLGDAVALIDHADSRDLPRKSCPEIEKLRGDLVNYGLKALFADLHFCPQAPTGYERLHRMAKSNALSAAASADLLTQEEILRTAFFAEAEALHYFTDNFAAGHIVARLDDRGDPIVTKKIHDYYNEHGRKVSNATGASWTAYGDGHARDDVAKPHRDRAVNAIAISLGAVVSTFIFDAQDEDLAVNEAPTCELTNVRIADPDESSKIPASLLHHDGEVRFTLGAAFQDFGDSKIRTTGLVLLDVGYVRPVTSFFQVAVGAETGFWTPALTKQDIINDADRTLRFRSVLGSLEAALGFHVHRSAKLFFGGTTRGGLLAPVNGKKELVWDGADFLTGTEIPLLNFSLRAGFRLGWRRSAVADGDYAFGVTATVGVAYRW